MTRTDALQGATVALLALIAVLQVVEIGATNDAKTAAQTAGFNASELENVTVPVKVTNSDPLEVNAAVTNKVGSDCAPVRSTPGNPFPAAPCNEHVEPLKVRIASPYELP
jgi:hypothetical protein